MTNNTPPRKIRGIRSPIKQGFVLGRLSAGDGDVEMIPLSANFATPQYVANTTVTQGSAAGGDLSGTYPNPTVAKIQGNAVKNAVPADGNLLTWVAANSDWEPKAPAKVTTWASFLIVDSTHYYVMMSVSLADPEAVLDGNGTPVYVLNPGFTP